MYYLDRCTDTVILLLLYLELNFLHYISLGISLFYESQNSTSVLTFIGKNLIARHSSHTHTHKVHAGDIILLIISTCHFSFTVLCSLVSAGVWLASKNEVRRYIDEAELPECVNKDCDTSTEDNVRIRILKLVFTFKHNGVSIYSMKCFKINKELTFIITCIHLDHCAT